MIGWGQVLAAQEIHNERLREAEEWHLAQLVLARKGAYDPFLHRTLDRLGRILAKWGMTLQVRYGKPAVEGSAPMVTGPSVLANRIYRN